MAMTERYMEVLADLGAFLDQANRRNADPYARPMDIGGANKSHHSVTLNRLVKRGLVERVERPGPVRRSYRYTLTHAGKILVRG